ncbi:MAG TPA: LysM peptidoglycan-binding domain-containing protein [Cyclobacteriaceae bacterium]|nr:LysM peptidoglycan-binding domain-containing protein [Cyclobacteriaceae bacterium]
MFQIILFTLGSALADSDSLRMETINGKPYVVHQVGEKETLYSLSRRYGATVAGILEQNPNADAGIEVGQILKIPYTAKVKSVSPVQTADGIVHKVAAKETLFSIARQYNVSVDDIKTWNNLKENTLSLGQELVIKKKTATVVTQSTTVQPTGARTHTVAAKETLFSIAKQYGMSIQQLKEWNGLQTDEVKLGQILSVAAPAGTVVSTTIDPVKAVTPGVKTENTVKISESVSGSDEAKETGMAELIEGTQGNRKYLAQHRTIAPGTILKIRNLNTNQEVFVRVTGPIPNPKDQTIICISKSAYDRLGATEGAFRAELTYYK